MLAGTAVSASRRSGEATGGQLGCAAMATCATSGDASGDACSSSVQAVMACGTADSSSCLGSSCNVMLWQAVPAGSPN
jgi:hypothetical protein